VALSVVGGSESVSVAVTDYLKLSNLLKFA
jgi:hypothetical protein